MERWKNWLLLSMSAVAYASAFLWVEYCFWLVFIFLIPVYYIAFKFPHFLKFKHGLWWGVQFFCIHHYAVVKVFHEHSKGDWPFVAAFLFVLYFALHAGLWFLLATRMVAYKKSPSPLGVGASWFAATLFYFYWVRYVIFWIFGISIGYAFGSPLLVLAQCPSLLIGLPLITETGLLAVLIAGQLGFAYALSKKSLVGCCLASCYMLVFLWGIIVGSQKIEVPEYVATLGYVKPSSKMVPIEQQIMDVEKRMTSLLSHNPALQTILLPESTFQIKLDANPHVIQYLSYSSVTKDINIFIGSNRSGIDKECNSLYWLKNGDIVNCYDKKNRTPFFEYVAFPWNQFAYFNNLFLKSWPGFDSKSRCLDAFELTPHISFIPRICSELYFSVDHHKLKCDARHPILFVTNETWFSAHYYRKLFYLYAVFQAIQSQRDIIYVGHEFGRWISGSTGLAVQL